MINFKKRLMDLFLKNHCKSKHEIDLPSQAILCSGCEFENINTGCTHPRHPDNVVKRRAEEKAKEIHVEAYDAFGNTFDKIVTCRHKNGTADVILSFGWPCEYSVASLIKHHYPFKDPLCIDATGRNHRGNSVYIKADDVNKFIKKAQDECWDH